MKIRLAIIDNDENYVKRLISNLQVNYADKLEPYFFSSYDLFLDFYRSNKVQVILVSEEIEVKGEEIPKDVSFAWLVSNNAVEAIAEYPAVGKFQKAELLYKSVLGLYADMESKIIFRGDGRARCIVFSSAQGGVGTSSVAAAFALQAAERGRRPLYLSFDKFSRSELFFQGDGNLGFSEVIYSLKTKKSNLPLKLESILKKDNSGTLFFDSCKCAGDILEINSEDIDLLFPALNGMETVDYLVVDMPLDFSQVCDTLMEKYADSIFIIDDGSTIGNIKLQRAMEILQLRQKEQILIKTRLLYNKFEPVVSKKIEGLEIPAAGEINVLQSASYRQMVEDLAKHPVIKQIG